MHIANTVVQLVARVKCDEAVPACKRCSRHRKSCYYVNGLNQNKPQGPIEVVAHIAREIDHWSKIPSHERRGLWHFQARTIDQLKGPFGSELWSNILPRMVWDDSVVRQSVLALSAFHEHYLDNKSPGAPPPDHVLAIYRKAVAQIATIPAPDNHLESILCACVIFSACEGLTGNFEESVRHAVAGMKIIAAQKRTAPSRDLVLGNAKGVLPNVFMELQAQVLEANIASFEIIDPAPDEQLEVPDRFENVEQAMACLHQLASRFLQLFQQAETYHEVYDWIPSQVATSLQPEHEAVCAAFSAWENAVSRSFSSTTSNQHAAYPLLEAQRHLFHVNQYVYVHGESRYDDLIHKIWMALGLIIAYLSPSTNSTSHSQPHHTTASSLSCSRPSTFTSSPEIVPLLFEIATRTNDKNLSRRAIQMLRECNRREGIWDSKIAAQLAEHIHELVQEGCTTAEKSLPGSRFLITHIQILSEKRCLIRYGFKKIRQGCFDSFWFENIRPEEGEIQTRIINLS